MEYQQQQSNNPQNTMPIRQPIMPSQLERRLDCGNLSPLAMSNHDYAGDDYQYPAEAKPGHGFFEDKVRQYNDQNISGAEQRVREGQLHPGQNYQPHHSGQAITAQSQPHERAGSHGKQSGRQVTEIDRPHSQHGVFEAQLPADSQDNANRDHNQGMHTPSYFPGG